MSTKEHLIVLSNAGFGTNVNDFLAREAEIALVTKGFDPGDLDAITQMANFLHETAKQGELS
ncbi:MAG: hypothetical protein WCK11_00985 [Candidatus Falkowbacteria bacterium]